MAAALAGESNCDDSVGRVRFHHPNPHYDGTNHPMRDVAPQASLWIAADMPLVNDVFALRLIDPTASFVDGLRAAKADVGITVLDGPEGTCAVTIHYDMPSGDTGVAAFCRLGADEEWHLMTIEAAARDAPKPGQPEQLDPPR